MSYSRKVLMKFCFSLYISFWQLLILSRMIELSGDHIIPKNIRKYELEGVYNLS